MRPEQALAVVFPEIVASWHPQKNGVHTPWNTSAKNSLVAHWRCAAGHEWSETVAGRTGMPAWKRGDRGACRICAGHVVVTAFTCGHSALVETRSSRPDRVCPACRRKATAQAEQQKPARRESARIAYAATEKQAKLMLAGIEVPDSLPPPLVEAWRSMALTQIRRALVAEGEFGKTGAAGTVKRQARLALAELPPTAERLRAAVEDRTPITVLGKAHWPLGWLHLLGHGQTTPEMDFMAVEALEGWLRTGLTAVAGPLPQERYDTATITKVVTGLVAAWADAQPRRFRRDRWLVYRELTIPMTPGGASRYGRLDVVVTRPHQADMVIEIDSTNNPRSVEKLRFAHAAGAVPVWIRWHSGALHQHPGIPVIDLREPDPTDD
ncbi:zinc-ribbon domain-containing protein [Umezawaea sp. Da 62-37]|uniref:zinc-ribbon domain-containing protein n=1 Tax=Umezawaea sp. Da 62-37 TaxID=3075927 RepID=UPI0028F70192|nr:zinc-ribbon domain-containing protein [Umezawaea sp. Da 62-37]WNV84728.1 zinc-ribbon domain-containing protein [Umezawaea sp. Da 62-37]